MSQKSRFSSSRGAYQSSGLVPRIALFAIALLVYQSSATTNASETELPSDADNVAAATSGTVPIGSQLADIRLTDSLGKEYSISDFQSKNAVVFAFLGTQCPLAKLYSAKLVELERKYRDQNVAFVAVNSNVQDSLV